MALLYSEMHGVLYTMSKLVAVRIPDLLMARVKTLGQGTSEVIVAALRAYLDGANGLDEAATPGHQLPVPVAEMRQIIGKPTNPLSIPGVRLGSAMFGPPEPPAEEEAPQCSYTEWSSELGETVRCGLPAHSHKVRHGSFQRGG